jgi:hypothetical protein
MQRSLKYNRLKEELLEGVGFERDSNGSKKMTLPLDSSLSSGCLRAVMSRKVHKKRTTTSRSFLMGAICNSNHRGEPATPITTN